jgi:hypothetical protein
MIAASRLSSSSRPMNAGLVNPPAMPASMAAASEEENEPARSAGPSLLGVVAT